MNDSIKLYDYFRSTACYRVRIALNLKNIPYSSEIVDLREGQQNSDEYRTKNAQKMVPVLKINDHNLAQSLAIMDYLEEKYPEPTLLPSDLFQRALVRRLAQMIACDIHPLNNLRVLNYLEGTLRVSPEQKTAWYHHWVVEGFSAIEQLLEQNHSNARFCLGEFPTLADICLIPQVYNAQRFEVNLRPFPLIQAINDHCLGLDAFKKAAP